MASHNSKYYAKKIRKRDSKGCASISALWQQKLCETSSESVTVTVEPPTQSLNTANLEGDECTEPSSLATDDFECTDTISESVSHSSHDPAEPESCTKVVIRSSNNYAKYELNYPWLYFSSAKGGLLCKYCELFPTTSKEHGMKWVHEAVQLSDHPVRQLDKHQSSDRHKNSLNKYTEATSAVFKKSRQPVYQMIIKSASANETNVRAKNRSVIKKLFRIAYFIARKYWAQASFKDMVRFIACLGVEDLQQHVTSAPDDANYLSDKSASEFLTLVGENIERKQLVSLRKARFFTLLADESADEQNREQLSIFIKWTTDTMVTEDHFTGLVNVERTDALSLLNAIQTFCMGKGIDITRCRFVGFDGANVMSGEVTGLQRRIRHLTPFCLYMNCRNHRLALCLKHLMKIYPLLVEADSVLLAMWKLFHYSPQRFDVFKSVQEAYGDVQVTLVRAATTRWLSHGAACVRFVDRYCACLDTLDAIYTVKKEPEVYGLRLNITNKNTLAMILLLCDVLKPVNVLSLSLQSADINFMDVEEKVKCVCNELEELVLSLQAHDAKLYFSKAQQLFQEIDDRTDLRRRMRGENGCDPDRFIETIGIPFINSLKGEITDAFACHHVFTAFRALDPRYLPESAAELINHGQNWIETLANHYAEGKKDTFQGHTTLCPADIDSKVLLRNEYTGFKHQMFMMRQSGRATTAAMLLNAFAVDVALQTCFPRMYQLVHLMCIIPTSTAVVERGFSKMNLLCTPLRSTFTQTKLTYLMMICIEGQSDLDDSTLEELCDAFKNMKQRKILV